MKIESIKLLDDGKIHIKSALNSPPQGAIVTLAITYPKAIIKFSNSTKIPVVFDIKEDNGMPDLSSDLK